MPVIAKKIYTDPKFGGVSTPYIGPSNIIQMCEREYAIKVQMRARGKTVGFSPQTRMNFIKGFAVEKILDELLNHMKIRILSDQVTIPADLEWFTSPRSRCDRIVEIDGIVYLIDAKAMNATRFRNFINGGLEAETSSHFQILQYLRKIPEVANLNHPLPTMGLLVGIQLDPLDVWDHEIEFSQEVFDKYLPRLEMIGRIKSTAETIIPPRPYARGSFYCKNCPVKDICWETTGARHLTKEDFTEEEWVKVVATLTQYVDVDIKTSIYNDKRESIRDDVDKILEEKQAGSMDVITDDWFVRPKISNFTQRRLDINGLKLGLPEVYKEYSNDSPVSQLRINYNPKKHQTKLEAFIEKAAGELEDDD